MGKRLIAIILFTGGALIILLAFFSTLHSNNSKSTTNTNTSSSASSNSVQANFNNENDLLNIGVTSGQLNNMEQALKQYLSSTGKNPSGIGFTSIQRLPFDKKATTPKSTISFVVQLDDKATYKAVFDSYSLTEIRLYLYNLDGSKLLYDSQNIGGSS